MTKIFIFIFLHSIFIIFISYAKSIECISTLTSQVCVGESHDSVIEKIPKSAVLEQTVTQNEYGPVVKRKYNILGTEYTIIFGRTGPVGPHRVLQIEE